MASKENFLNNVKVVATIAAEESQCSVISVTFNKSTDGRVLKVVIDGTNTGLDVCAAISRKLSDWLDAHESETPPVEYSLEVSSPGLDKPLKNKSDFEKLVGKLIYLETKTKAADGRKRYTGRLLKVERETAFLYVEKESAEFAIAIGNISKAHAEYDFREE